MCMHLEIALHGWVHRKKAGEAAASGSDGLLLGVEVSPGWEVCLLACSDASVV